MKFNLTTFTCGALVILSIVTCLLGFAYKFKEWKAKKVSEGFLATPEGATVTPQGAIVGPAVYTNSLMRGNPQSLLKQVQETGKARDESCMVMGARNNKSALDDVYKSQLKVIDIQNKSNNGFQQIDDLKAISKEIAGGNSVKGMFQRDGCASTKLVIDKYATVGVIDEQYMPSRDRPKELRAVGTAIIMPGFAFDATKALDSNGTGICPKGGVPGVGIERHKKKTSNLLTIAQPAGEAEKPSEIDKTLAANGIMNPTTVSDVNQQPVQ